MRRTLRQKVTDKEEPTRIQMERPSISSNSMLCGLLDYRPARIYRFIRERAARTPAKSEAVIAVIALILLIVPTIAVSSDADIERRITALLERMTLEEKLGQLQILDGEANG